MGVFSKMVESGSANLKYYGSHPLFPKECKMRITVNANEFMMASGLKKHVYNLSEVKNVSIQTEKEVMERFTATRIALLGPFALAFKKKKVSKHQYLVIECDDAIITFEGDTFLARTFAEKMYTNIRNLKNN
jgi:NAD kinase